MEPLLHDNKPFYIRTQRDHVHCGSNTNKAGLTSGDTRSNRRQRQMNQTGNKSDLKEAMEIGLQHNIICMCFIRTLSHIVK